MSRRGGSLDTSHSDSEGSLDSTARSKWQLDTGDSEGGPSRIPDNRIPKNLSKWVHNKGSFESSENFESESSSNTSKIEQDFLSEQPGEHPREWTREEIARGYIRSRKSVTVVRHFPPGFGRNVRGQPEKDKEKVTVASKPLRKVSGVRHFPPGCGRNAASMSDEKYRRIQQA
ncbi:PREDICTED: uncharacterized protein LOC108661931 [Theobroma cacao]|uniref:Uncharacterized protein LOC108661931 n=1 Tax=Theobroma cacao TaxID=3641 RepID=A0AB32W938_THECC|nr:PREDICTED: uncharacterized protein LOC108661931 [Theobroma cacao]